MSAQAGAHCSICHVWKSITATHEEKKNEEVDICFFFNMHFKKKGWSRDYTHCIIQTYPSIFCIVCCFTDKGMRKKYLPSFVLFFSQEWPLYSCVYSFGPHAGQRVVVTEVLAAVSLQWCRCVWRRVYVDAPFNEWCITQSYSELILFW